MASSSVSQEDVDIDFVICSRRSRIRTARARNINPPPPPPAVENNEDGHGSEKESCCVPGVHSGHQEHDASPKPVSRIKEKRLNRPTHGNKGKQQRDRRKLREKRRSTGVVQLYSTESTGGSTGEDEELLSMTAETRRNTHLNENLEKKEAGGGGGGGSAKDKAAPVPPQFDYRHKRTSFTATRCKSPSDLEADDEDNQDYDSLTMSDSTLSLVPGPIGLDYRDNLGTQPGFCCSGSPKAAPATNGIANSGLLHTNHGELLKKTLEENKRLFFLIEEKDKTIASLEAKLVQLSSNATQLKGDVNSGCQDNQNIIARPISAVNID